MNVKEDVVRQLLEIVASCCSYTRKDGSQSITPDDIVSKERIGDNVNLTRCIFARQMKVMGFTTETIADILQRNESTIRDMIIRGGDMEVTNYAYRVASSDVTQHCKSLMSEL